MTHARPRYWLLALVVGVAAAVVTWFRVPAYSRNIMYAEDGMFVQDWYDGSAPLGVFQPYAGYQHLLPRLLAWVVRTFTPIDAWALGTTAAACVGLGLVAGLACLASSYALRDPLQVMAVGLVPALVPIGGIEGLGNLANLHWYLLYLGFWVVLAQPDRPASRLGWALAAFASAMTEIQVALLLPLVAWRWWTSPRSRIPIAGWALGLTVQVVTFLSAGRSRSAEGYPTVWGVIRGYLANAVLSNLDGTPRAPSNLIIRYGWWPAFAMLGAVVALIVLTVVLGHRVHGLLALLALTVSFASWTLAMVFNNSPYLQYVNKTFSTVRWGTAAAMLFLATLPLVLDALLASTAPVVARLAMLLVLAGLTPSLLVPNPHRLEPSWTVELARARTSCAAGADSVTVTTAPRDWHMRLPCRLVS